MSEPVPFPQPRFGPPMDEPTGPAEITPSLIEMARAVAAICATRVLLLLAILTSAVIWTWTVIEPEHLRIIAATAYSVVTVWPLVLLFHKRG